MQETSTRLIPLTQGQFAVVDAEDYERVIGHPYPWHVANTAGIRYASAQARRGRGSPQITMHRLVLTAVKGQTVDHVDGDGLNNRKSNLRFVTTAQNGRNSGKKKATSSTFKGVSHHPKSGRWHAIIGMGNKKNKWLGSYADEAEAAKAYDQAAREHFGEHARTNF